MSLGVISKFEENSREANNAMFAYIKQKADEGDVRFPDSSQLVLFADACIDGCEPYEWEDLASCDKSEWPEPELAFGFTLTHAQFRKLHDKHKYSRIYPEHAFNCDYVREHLCRFLQRETACEDLFMAEPEVLHADHMVGIFTNVGFKDAANADTRKREREILLKLMDLLETDMPPRWYWLKEVSMMANTMYR
ncbi:hypothetical protein EUX98_g9141 [Antrodiella citrinella]|uniref:Uncharacterized protein n=1 Tax=Antrodiella citrinella TaxID=2447956 RepID=A0A4S4LXK6_9APHY|nr:hypothetical protein EUX98_g9141 [Antrodiella citrinella]